MPQGFVFLADVKRDAAGVDEVLDVGDDIQKVADVVGRMELAERVFEFLS